MHVSTASIPFERPGKTSTWTHRTARRTPPAHGSRGFGPSTQPTLPNGGSLDPVRSAFWQAYRHLFPPHALAAQTANGGIVISWSIQDDPLARYPYAAPVMLRFDEALVDAMARAESRQRGVIALRHEQTLREGLRGYDPFANLPNARIITIG